jgi:hypothetical protein
VITTAYTPHARMLAQASISNASSSKPSIAQGAAIQEQPRFSGDIGNAIGGFITMALGVVALCISGGLQGVNHFSTTGKAANTVQTAMTEFQASTSVSVKERRFSELFNRVLDEVKSQSPNKPTLPNLELTTDQQSLFNSLLEKADKAKTTSDLKPLFETWLENGLSNSLSKETKVDLLEGVEAFFKSTESYANKKLLLNIAMGCAACVAGFGFLRMNSPGNSISDMKH